MYLYYYIFVKGRLCLYLLFICPYHTKMNKSLVPEWPCIIEVSYIYPPTLSMFLGLQQCGADGCGHRPCGGTCSTWTVYPTTASVEVSFYFLGLGVRRL